MFGLLFKLNPRCGKCEENFPTTLYRPRAQFWHPFPLVGNPCVMEEAGNWDLLLQINHPPSLGNENPFLTQHPWGSDSSGWEFLFLCFPSSLSGDREQSPMFFVWLSTRLSSNLCLGVTLVGLIFVYGDQLGQIWWEGLPQNIDWVLISFSREEGSWGFGLDVHLTVTQLVTCCPHRSGTPEADLVVADVLSPGCQDSLGSSVGFRVCGVIYTLGLGKERRF